MPAHAIGRDHCQRWRSGNPFYNDLHAVAISGICLRYNMGPDGSSGIMEERLPGDIP
ncbi:MAG: hypothetical protein MI923_13290 [Phycisphaerales bacterium]|nr:hypothetical protein [Phycisphaerales bacterium]